MAPLRERAREDTGCEVHPVDVVQLGRPVRFYQPIATHAREYRALPEELSGPQPGDSAPVAVKNNSTAKGPGYACSHPRLPRSRGLIQSDGADRGINRPKVGGRAVRDWKAPENGERRMTRRLKPSVRKKDFGQPKNCARFMLTVRSANNQHA